MKKIFFVVPFCTALTAYSQTTNTTKDTTQSLTLDEVVISASNFTERKKNIAQIIDVIGSKKIAQTNAQNTGDLLVNTGKVFVQKSQQGGSSPVLRGFEASRVLLVIDGVRMNNAIYRAGHLQNSITVDQNMLSRVEVLYGPSSTIYGGDALGGAIHLVTKSPALSPTGKLHTTGSTFLRYSSVNNEKTMHADVSMGGKKLAWLQSYNFSDFGDMKMGSNYPDKYPNFGSRDSFVVTNNNVDEIVVNGDPKVQKFSGYKQWDITQKLLFKQNERISHLLNVQFSNPNNVPRYDRLQDIRNGRLRYAEWFYGPQKRLLTAYELNGNHLLGFDGIKLNINYQDIEESRQTRDFRRYDRFDSRVEKVKVFGATISGRKIMGNNELTIGADMQLNDVKSSAFRKSILTGEETKLDTRYPDGRNRMNYFALFAQHVFKAANGKLVINDGIRLQLVNLKSNVLDNSFFHLPDTAAKQSNFAGTGNIGMVYTASKNTTLRATLSSGFRVPNLDDLKIFESATSAKQVVVPNSNIKPEYTYNLDLAIEEKLGDKISVDLTGFYTLFRNAIVKAPYQLNGQDSIIYNGTKSQVLASQNSGKANLYGFTAGLNVEIFTGFTLSSTISYTHGRYKTDVSKTSQVYEKQPNGTYQLVNKKVSSIPLDHIPPVFGKTSFNYQHKLFNTELTVLYNGWKRLDMMNTAGEDNQQYATADGFPAWTMVNWRGNVKLTKSILFQLGVENIFDRNYRYFASGFSAGGRNFFATARVTW
ncbi:MAG: TonB-dependent receptor [Chitinophagaceae bacterium]|nr:TonB-dependent receptor [Chitinophagaceae bacterium]